MKSRFPGRCPACTQPIAVGDEIARRSQDGPWLHDACARVPEELALDGVAPRTAPAGSAVTAKSTAKATATASRAKRAVPAGMVEPAGAREVFTDGACSGNPGPGGWAWALSEAEHASGGAPATTNQRMEVQAAYEAVRALAGPLVVVSDSTYVVNCFRDGWWRGWVSRGWRNAAKQPVANRDLWQPFVELVQQRDDLAFRWVKGHSGDPMNDLVDRLAVAERERIARG